MNVEELMSTLGIAWLRPATGEVGATFIELEGEVERLPDLATLDRKLRAMGWAPEMLDEQALLGKRGRERLELRLSPRDELRNHGPSIELRWRDYSRRPVAKGTRVPWGGRDWPVLLEDASICQESRSSLMLEGRLPPTGRAEVSVAQYRAWASEAGMSEQRPPDSLSSVELDLAGDVCFCDERYEMKLHVHRYDIVVIITLRANDR